MCVWAGGSRSPVEQFLAQLGRGRLAELAQALAVVDRLADQRRAKVAGVGVADRPGGGNDRDPLMARDIARVEILAVDDVLSRNGAPRAMTARDGDAALFAGPHPVDARIAPRAECVALGQRLPVRGVGDREARTDRVACAQECPEVGLERDPQRGRDEVVPAAVMALPPSATDVARPGLGGAQRAGAHALSWLMLTTVPAGDGGRCSQSRMGAYYAAGIRPLPLGSRLA